MIVAVATACAALTVTTTAWATASHREQQESDLRTAVSHELNRERTGLFAALAENPDARTLEELIDAGWRAEDTIGLGILIPLEGQTAAIDPAMALQYSFINSMEPVAERYPDCLRPDWWPTGGHMAETATIWSESCGPYLLAYAFAQPGTSLAAAKPWLVIQALYLPDQDDPVPSLRTTLLLWSAVIVASAALFSLAPARSIVRPVARAGQMAAQVADGDLSVRIPVYGTDDIATMSASINTMADRLTDKITAASSPMSPTNSERPAPRSSPPPKPCATPSPGTRRRSSSLPNSDDSPRSPRISSRSAAWTPGAPNSSRTASTSSTWSPRSSPTRAPTSPTTAPPS
jgi:HAMP domain-containing protein